MHHCIGQVRSDGIRTIRLQHNINLNLLRWYNFFMRTKNVTVIQTNWHKSTQEVWNRNDSEPFEEHWFCAFWAKLEQVSAFPRDNNALQWVIMQISVQISLFLFFSSPMIFTSYQNLVILQMQISLHICHAIFVVWYQLVRMMLLFNNNKNGEDRAGYFFSLWNNKSAVTSRPCLYSNVNTSQASSEFQK